MLLAGGRIGGSLHLSEATLTNPNNGALLADALVVGENVYCDKLKTCGEVDLDGAAISGFADFTGARLDSSHGLAFMLKACRPVDRCSFGQNSMHMERSALYGLRSADL